MQGILLVLTLVMQPQVGEFTTNDKGWSHVSEQDSQALLRAYKITPETEIFIDGDKVKTLPENISKYKVYSFKVDNQGNFIVLLLITKKIISNDFNLGTGK
jgi:hypothetical protein